MATVHKTIIPLPRLETLQKHRMVHQDNRIIMIMVMQPLLEEMPVQGRPILITQKIGLEIFQLPRLLSLHLRTPTLMPIGQLVTMLLVSNHTFIFMKLPFFLQILIQSFFRSISWIRYFR